MDSDSKTRADSVVAQKCDSTVSLWETLHDGEVLAIKSDLLARTVTASFDVGYLREFHQLQEGTQFVIKVDGVRSAILSQHVSWPGEFSVPKNLSYEEESKLKDEHYRKGRKESVSWSELERLINTEAEVSNAVFARQDDSVVLELGLLTRDDLYYYLEATIRGDTMSFYIGERSVTAEEFLAFGEAYWEAFSKRSGD